MRKILLYFSLKYQGDYQKIYQAIKQKEKVTPEDLNHIEQKIQSQYVTLIDEAYPESFKHIPNPPWVLYYYGNLSLLCHPLIIGVIGTRNASLYGKEMCKRLIQELKDENCCIISGLAKGIDGLAHQEALKQKLNTIAVLGSGIDYCYPKSNQKLYQQIKQEGLVISEYPNQRLPQKKDFLIRNRLIAACCQYLVVVEAQLHSGTMNTVTYALEYGKDVGCIPTMANQNSGCNFLIQQGAKLIEHAKDIFE